jgi:hypothetical protein
MATTVQAGRVRTDTQRERDAMSLYSLGAIDDDVAVWQEETP